MSDEALLRWLEVVQRQLGARDAYVQIGGERPQGDAVLWEELPGGRRIVVRLESPPADPDGGGQRLRALVEAFAELSRDDATPSPAQVGADTAAALAAALARLAVRADALQAIVIDASSPVIWGTSHAEPALAAEDATVRRRAELLDRAEQASFDVAGWLADYAREGRAVGHGAQPAVAKELAAELVALLGRGATERRADWERWRLATRAVAACRRQLEGAHPLPASLRCDPVAGGPIWHARSFATIYVLLLVFAAPFSELQAEGEMIRSLGTIERLVLSLPPVDPPRRGAKVVRMPPRGR